MQIGIRGPGLRSGEGKGDAEAGESGAALDLDLALVRGYDGSGVLAHEGHVDRGRLPHLINQQLNLLTGQCRDGFLRG